MVIYVIKQNNGKYLKGKLFITLVIYKYPINLLHRENPADFPYVTYLSRIYLLSMQHNAKCKKNKHKLIIN